MPTPPQAIDIPRDLEALRPTLIRIARMHLRNDAWAEDAVSETLLAVLEGRTQFAGRSQLKTWVVGILKHKIIDTLRARRREAPLAIDPDDRMEDDLFKPDGHYETPPSDWPTPEESFSRNQFFEILQVCIDQLPPPQARIFMLREWMELTTQEICNELTVTPTNAGVLLHRARLRLRECLEMKWVHSRSA
jgi:RNA polymerase sigma-70 factor, ECF subfamily